MRHEALHHRPVEARLERALAAAGRTAGVDATVAAHRARPWASATFVGVQHDMTLTAPRSPGLGRWVATLPDTELAMRGHLVASLAVERIEDDGTTVLLSLTILTIEE